MAKPREQVISQELPKCTKLDGTFIQRAIHNEHMAVGHRLVKCREHNLFHTWVEVTDQVVHNEHRSRAKSAKTDGYFRLRSGRYLPETGKKKS